MFDEGVVTDAIEVSPIDGRRLVGLDDAPTTDFGRGSRLPSQDLIRRTIGSEGKRRPDGRRQHTQTEEDVTPRPDHGQNFFTSSSDHERPVNSDWLTDGS